MYQRRRTRYPKWYRIPEVLPGELKGSLHAEYVRCGKANCRCASGREDDRHGPYWYRYWRDEDGTLRKAYVSRKDLDRVRQAIARRRGRLAMDRARRNKHMRRGEGRGKPAHVWERERRTRDFSKRLRALHRLLQGR